MTWWETLQSGTRPFYNLIVLQFKVGVCCGQTRDSKVHSKGTFQLFRNMCMHVVCVMCSRWGLNPPPKKTSGMK